MSDQQPTLQDPWYLGSGTNPLVGVPDSFIAVAVDGEGYLIDVRKYQRGFIDPYRNAQDNSNQPGEQTLTTEGVWARYGTDWRYGAGQAKFDRQDSNRSRYAASIGIDPWTEGQVKLLQNATIVRSESKTYVKILTGRNGELIVARTDGVDVGTGAYPGLTFNSVTGLPGAAITDITCDDATVWVATGAGVYSFPLATLVATRWETDASPLAWDSVLISNGRLVGGVANTLREIGVSGAVTTLRYTHPSPAFRFTVLFGHPRFIYGGGTLGDRAELFRFGVDGTTGALAPGVSSLSLPGGEALRSGIHYVGKVFITTSRGLRMADVSQDGDLSYGAAIEAAGDSRCVTGYGDYVWFGWSNIESGKTGTGRLAPARLGDDERIAPAYASDVYYEGTGTVSGCTVYAGRITFGIDGVGIAMRSDAYVTSGWLTTGAIDYNIPYTVQPLYVLLRHEPLLGTIGVEWRQPLTNWIGLGVSGAANSRTSSRLGFPSVVTESTELRLTLNRKSATETPVLQQWLLNASPQPERIQQILLPVVVADGLTYHDQRGPIESAKPLAMWQHLAGLCASGRIVNYQEGPTTYRVRVKDVQVSDASRWSDDNEFFDAIVPVILQVVSQ